MIRKSNGFAFGPDTTGLLKEYAQLQASRRVNLLHRFDLSIRNSRDGTSKSYVFDMLGMGKALVELQLACAIAG